MLILDTDMYKYAQVFVFLCVCNTHMDGMLATAFRLVGLRMSLSSVLTMSVKRGRALRSFCQQSNMSWCRAVGQSIGAGSL